METPTHTPNETMAETDAHIQADARRWLVSIYAGDVDQARFRVWLAAAPEHARAYRALEQAWRDLALSDRSDIEIRRTPSRARLGFALTRRWMGPGALAASLLLCVAAGLVWKTTGSSHDGRVAPTTYATKIATLRTVNLSDGSTVALGADSVIAAQFTQTARAITMNRGTAYFDIAHDPSRPLTVKAGNASLRVLGTAFEVWTGPSGVRLSVVRGRVAVDMKGTAAMSLGAGKQITIGIDGSVSAVTPFAPDDLLAWRKGRLVYRDAALSDIVADLNRYRAAPIRLIDKRAETLRITAAFAIGQGEQILAGLAASQPIVVRKTTHGLIIQSATH